MRHVAVVLFRVVSTERYLTFIPNQYRKQAISFSQRYKKNLLEELVFMSHSFEISAT